MNDRVSYEELVREALERARFESDEAQVLALLAIADRIDTLLEVLEPPISVTR